MIPQGPTVAARSSLIKRSVKRVVSVRTVNALLRGILIPFASLLPRKTLLRLPVVGVVALRLPNGKTVYFETDGSDQIAPYLYWEGVDGYEPETIRLFTRLIEHADTVFDVGAYTGLYALIAGVSDPGKRVYAFEPVPAIRGWLKKNVELNKLCNIVVEGSAVTDHEGRLDLYVPGTDVCGSRMPSEASALQGFRAGAVPVSVPAVTLDSFVDANRISRVDLIKMDIEGAEPLALRGAMNVLKRDHPMVICEVLTASTGSALQEVLEDMGYRYFRIAGEGLVEKARIEPDPEDGSRDYLFVAGDRVDQVLRGQPAHELPPVA